MENEIFKALADPSRRTLLDLLHSSDGRTLNELCAHLELSRFGVMKHLNILEEAGLITTCKVGREKLHYLNAVPIRQLYERWVSKYAEPWTIELTSLKSELEREPMLEQKPRHVHRIAIKASPEQVWQAITNPIQTSKFWFNCAIRSTWDIGASFELRDEAEEKKAEGVVLTFDAPHKLVLSWRFTAFPHTAGDTPSRIYWEIIPHPELTGVTLVTLIHDDFEHAAPTAAILENGMPVILSGLKTFLETGTTLSGD